MAEIGEALRRHERIGIDTPVFIYHLEAAAPYAQPSAPWQMAHSRG